MANALTRAEFFGTPVSIIDHAGRRWLTAEEAGRCLGYNEANVSRGVRSLYDRHADEFTEADACRINLFRQGQNRESLIFSATGCNLLGFFSNTPRAKDFRVWAKQFLAGAVPPAPTPAPGRLLPGWTRVTRRAERLAMERFVAGETITEIGKALGFSRSTASLVLHGKYQFAPGAGAAECSAELIAAVAARHLAIEQERLAEAQERIAQRYLTTANNQALALALEQVGRQLQRRPENALAALRRGD